MEEHELSGGNASTAVMRVGNTVRKPWTASTPSVNAFVEALREPGVAMSMARRVQSVRLECRPEHRK